MRLRRVYAPGYGRNGSAVHTPVPSPMGRPATRPVPVCGADHLSRPGIGAWIGIDLGAGLPQEVVTRALSVPRTAGGNPHVGLLTAVLPRPRSAGSRRRHRATGECAFPSVARPVPADRHIAMSRPPRCGRRPAGRADGRRHDRAAGRSSVPPSSRRRARRVGRGPRLRPQGRAQPAMNCVADTASTARCALPDAWPNVVGARRRFPGGERGQPRVGGDGRVPGRPDTVWCTSSCNSPLTVRPTRQPTGRPSRRRATRSLLPATPPWRPTAARPGRTSSRRVRPGSRRSAPPRATPVDAGHTVRASSVRRWLCRPACPPSPPPPGRRTARCSSRRAGRSRR